MSDNLSLTQLSTSQANKETTINDKDGELDAAITEVLAVLVDNTNAATVTQAQLQRAFILDITEDSPAPTAAITITIDTAFERGCFGVRNSTAQDVTVEITSQTGDVPQVEAGDTLLVMLDGTEVVALSAAGPGIPEFSGAIVSMAAAQSIPDSTNTVLDFDTEIYDLGGWHESVTNPSRLTVPAGVTKIIIETWVKYTANATGRRLLNYLKNGVAAAGDGMNSFNFDAASSGVTTLSSTFAPIDVVEGDYFEVNTFQNSGGALDVSEDSFFSIRAVSSELTVSQPYDIGVFVPGVPTASQKIVNFVCVRAFTLPADLAASQAFLATAATAQTDFDIQKNEVSIGTIRFAAAGTVATFVGVSSTAFAAGDRVNIVAPGTPDTTAADLSVTLRGTR